MVFSLQAIARSSLKGGPGGFEGRRGNDMVLSLFANLFVVKKHFKDGLTGAGSEERFQEGIPSFLLSECTLKRSSHGTIISQRMVTTWSLECKSLGINSAPFISCCVQTKPIHNVSSILTWPLLHSQLLCCSPLFYNPFRAAVLSLWKVKD